MRVPPRHHRIACAGWSIPRAHAAHFTGAGTALERYARVFDAVEVNSTFYRTPRKPTCQRWCDSVPDGFRFSLKLPRTLTHYARLRDPQAGLDMFLSCVDPLRGKLGAVLAQLPPSLVFDAPVADAFFAAVRERLGQRLLLACEPRHASWDAAGALAVLEQHRVSRVAADPPRFGSDAAPAGAGPAYWRWHGSPRVYYDRYSDPRLDVLAAALRDDPDAWAVFDNTASGHATGDALRLRARMRGQEIQRDGEAA